MKIYVCNPVNISYKYQFIQMFRMKVENGKFVGNIPGKESVTREAADPSMIEFKGKYYLFPSVSKGFWVSENLADWEYVRLHNTPHNDYAPDVRVVGDYIYFCASKRGEICPFYRTKDPMSGIFEVLPGSFDFWDPNLFCDDDGKMYFYWGCTNRDPVFGVELNPDDMTKKGEVHSMIPGKPDLHGFERIGENHILPELGPDASELEKKIRQYCGTAPYIEGAWMTKYKGKYYLQYAAPGTEYNIYADGVYVSDNPLEGFEYANNNPYSYKPGGFITGAGHGSTMCDKYGNWWHVATMRISKGHQFERRIGLFPAGFDADGELFCNQRYGDFPLAVTDGKIDPWAEPEQFLLSYKKPVKASSYTENCSPENAVNEDIRNWWKAASSQSGEWLEVDLGEICSVKSVQINFADDNLSVPLPNGAERISRMTEARYIDDGKDNHTQWILEGSSDGKTYTLLCDKSNVISDLPHDFVNLNNKLRFIRLKVIALPYDAPATVSGLRVFGIGNGKKPEQAVVTKAEVNGLDAKLEWRGNAMGYTVLWGYLPEKLYHSCTVYENNGVNIGALNKGQKLFARIDSFNENGITHGKVFEV